LRSGAYRRVNFFRRVSNIPYPTFIDQNEYLVMIMNVAKVITNINMEKRKRLNLKVGKDY